MTDKGTILVVEDIPADLELLVDTLTAEGYQVLPADSGELALASVAARQGQFMKAVFRGGDGLVPEIGPVNMGNTSGTRPSPPLHESALAARPPELILLDIRLPGLDGFEVCRRLKARPESRDIPVVFISASGESAERLEGLKLGAVDYITKPFRREELLARVQIHLELGRLRIRLDQQAADLRQANERLQSELAERKRVEEALQLRNILLSAQQEVSIDGMLVVDENARILSYNHRFIELWGLPATLVAGKADEPVLRFVTAQARDPQSFLQRVEYLYEHRQETSRDELSLADGRVLDRYSAPMFGPEGRYYGRVWYFRDITARKREETALMRLAAIIESSDDAIIGEDLGGVITSWNKGAEKLFGYAASDMVGTSITRLLPAERQDEENQILGQLTRGESVEHFETLRQDKGGRLIEVSITVSPIKDATGKVIGVSKVARDITERKRAEESSRASQQLIEGIINAIPVRVFWKDKNLVYLGCNAVFARDAGFAEPNDLIGKDDYQMGWRDQAELYRAGDRQVIESGCPKPLVEEPQTTPEGNTITLLTSKIPLRGSKGEICGIIGTSMDVTEHKQAEAALRRTSELLLRTGELAKVGGWELDLRTMKLFWSVETCRIHEVDPPVAPALDQAINFYAPEARPVIRAAVQAGIDTGASFDLDLPLTTANGRPIWVRAQGSAVMEDGKAVKLLGAFQDITERSQAEAALRRSEAKFRSLYDSTSDAVMLSDTKGFFDCNQAALAMFGCGTREEFCSNHPADVSPPVQPDGTDSLTLAQQHMARAMEKGHYQFEWMHKRIDTGETFPAEVLLCALDLDGKRVLQGTIRDITKRKRSEESLRLQTAALEAAANAVAITNPKGTILWVNPAFTQLTGYSAAEAIGQNPRVLKSGQHPEPFYQELWETISKGHAWKGELINRRKDGQLYDEEMTITPVRDRAGAVSHYVAIKQDITERKEAESRLAGLQRQLLGAAREAGMAEVATSVLHNVGNVLNSVNISTGLIVASVRKSRASSLARVVVLLREHAHDLGAFITNDARGKHLPAYLAQLSEHLLAEQAANAGELDSLRRNVEHIKEIVAMQQNYATFGGVKEMINVAELVEDSLRLNAGAMSRHDVEVIREIAPVPPLNVEKHKVLQIMVNLLRNAKHACQDSERADKRLTVRVANGDGRIRISVIDNGVGIPTENLTRIFNHGFTTRKDGHGFGLHSGALAAKEMGGALTVHSDGVGQGAAFTLELPCPTREHPHE